MDENLKNLLNLTGTEAKDYFLEEENYANLNLPDYFTFKEVLDKARTLVDKENFEKHSSKARNFEGVNYKIIANKDGLYAWRPLQLIHPLLYVSLVNTITKETNWRRIKKKFKEFQTNKKIQCVSIPIVPQEKTKHSKQSKF